MPGSVLSTSMTNPVSPLLFESLTASAFDVTNQTINLGTNHNLTTGSIIFFNSSNSNHQTGLVLGGRYFAIVVNATTIKLASSANNAIAGISTTFTAPNADVTNSIRKIYRLNSRGSIHNMSLYPCYAKSSIDFNSSIPVEVNISYPAYQSTYSSFAELSTDTLLQVCGFRNPVNNNIWYSGVGSNTFTMVQIASGGNNASDSGVYLTNAATTGWNQRYVINSSRRIEFWASVQGSNLSLISTSTAIDPNTSLVFEYGANFNNLSVNNCNIKYL